MSFFVVKYCQVKACLNWRLGNNCVKDRMHIPSSVPYIADLHDSFTCEVRKQINKYRLQYMLENKS